MVQSKQRKFEDNFDLLEFGIFLWSKKTWILFSALICIAFAVLYLSVRVDQYETSSDFMANKESAESSSKGLGSLASLAGLGNSTSTGFGPNSYPLIVNSLPFQLELLNEEIHFKELDTTMSLGVYFNYYAPLSFSDLLLKYTVKLPKTLKKLILNKDDSKIGVDSVNYQVVNGIYALTPQDRIALRSLKESYTLEVGVNDVVNITTFMPDVQASALLNSRMTELLKKYVVKYNVNKAEEDLKRIQKSYDEAHSNYLKAQINLANYVDGNQRVTSSAGNIQRQSLQNQYNVAFSIYSGLNTQLEQAKMALIQDTPIFTIINPIVFPNKPNGSSAVLILIFSSVAGMLICVSTMFLIQFSKVVINVIGDGANGPNRSEKLS